MNVFERVTEDGIKKLILSSSVKSCDLDPAYTSVLKMCLDFKETFKEAYVRPLFKNISP